MAAALFGRRAAAARPSPGRDASSSSSATLPPARLLSLRVSRSIRDGTASTRPLIIAIAAAASSSSSSSSRSARDDDPDDGDAALARRRALFLLADGGDSNTSSPRNPSPLRIWRVGIDEPRLLKALEGAGLAGRVVLVPSLAPAGTSGADQQATTPTVVLAVARKAAGGRQRVDLSAARAAARNARAEFVLLRATTARAVFEALAPMVARREVVAARRRRRRAGEEEDDDEDAVATAAAALVERMRREAPALRGQEGDDGEEDDNQQGFARVPTLRAVAAVASGEGGGGPASASSALRLLDLLAWSEDVAGALGTSNSPQDDASRRPLLTPPRAARLPEPAWLWLGTAGAAAGEGGDDNDASRAAVLVPRNRDARADAAFRVSRDDGGPLQPGRPGDAKRRRQAEAERMARRGG